MKKQILQMLISSCRGLRKTIYKVLKKYAMLQINTQRRVYIDMMSIFYFLPCWCWLTAWNQFAEFLRKNYLRPEPVSQRQKIIWLPWRSFNYNRLIISIMSICNPNDRKYFVKFENVVGREKSAHQKNGSWVLIGLSSSEAIELQLPSMIKS